MKNTMISSFLMAVISMIVGVKNVQAFPHALWSTLFDGRTPLQTESLVDAQVEEMYRLLVIETAINEENYAKAAQEAFYFVQHFRVEDHLAELALRFYDHEGEIEKAYQVAQRWYQAKPTNDEAWSEYATMLAQTEQDQSLIALLQQKIKETQDRDKALTLVSKVLGTVKEGTRAFRLFEQVVENFQFETALYHLLMAEFAINADQFERAWTEVFKAKAQDPDSEAVILRLIELSKGSYRQEGLKTVKTFLQTHPQARIAYLSYIAELSKDDNFDEAFAAIKKMQAYAPEDFELLFFEALIYYDARQWKQARQPLSQFIEIQTQRLKNFHEGSTGLEERLTEAYSLLISTYTEEKKYRLALNELNKLLENEELRDYIVPDLYMEKAVLLTRLNSVHEALQVLDVATIRFPPSRGSFLWLGGNLLNESGRTDQAIVYYNDALKEFPKHSDIKYALAMLYETRGELWTAEILLREVIKDEPELPDAYNALGYMFADRQYNLDEALVLLKEAVRLDPSNPHILDSMGWLQFRLKNYSLALDYLEKSYELLPNIEVVAHLIEIHHVMGNPERVKVLMKESQALEGKKDVLQDTLKRLNLDGKIK